MELAIHQGSRVDREYYGVMPESPELTDALYAVHEPKSISRRFLCAQGGWRTRLSGFVRMHVDDRRGVSSPCSWCVGVAGHDNQGSPLIHRTEILASLTIMRHIAAHGL